jgi:hypothetical protein
MATSRLMFKWLNRLSQRRSIPWARSRPSLKDRVLRRIRIVYNLYPVPVGRTHTSELNRVTHLVRFYEGSVTYRHADAILRHRRETRR